MHFNFRKVKEKFFNFKKKNLSFHSDTFQIKRIKLPKLKQIRYLIYFLNREEKFTIYILLSIGLFSLFLFFVRINQSKVIYLPTKGGEYTEGVIGQPKLINPLFAQKNDVDLDIVRLLYSGLFKYDKNLNIVPDLVDHYTVNEEKTIYRFYLKKNIFWHDGEKFTSDDVIFTFSKIKEINRYFEDVNFEKIDDFQLKVTLFKPKRNFLNHLTVGILPKHIWENISQDKLLKSIYNLKPIGTGPFVFDLFVRDKKGKIFSYTVKRNERFYNHPPYISKITFKFFDNLDQELNALKKKKIEGLKYVPLGLENLIPDSKYFQNYKLKFPQFTAVFFNLNDKTLQSKTIRKVLAYTVPKEKIKEILKENGKIISYPVVSENFKKLVIDKYSYNPEKAEKILKNTGWVKNKDGYFEKDKNVLEIKITTADQALLKGVGRLIQKSWEDAGIKTSLAIYPLEVIDEIIKKKKYQVLLYGIIKSFNSDLNYALWHSSQIKERGINLSNFSNEKVDKLLEKMNKIPYEDVRKRKFKELQNILFEEVPAVFLYTIQYQYFLPKKIKGFAVKRINLPCDRFNNITDWYIKTKRVKK